MTNVKVKCTGDCAGTGVVETIRRPAGGYGPNHTEPDYRESACETCGGDGFETITRAAHLARSLEKMEARLSKERATRLALAFAAKVSELV